MSFINSIIERAKSNKKRIVLPETMDKRTLEATQEILKRGIADIILIGNRNELTTSSYDLSGARIIDTLEDKELTEDLARKFYELRKHKGMTLEEARKTITSDYMYYACMLVHEGLADGVVSGACHSTANTLRPALQIIKNNGLVSAFFLMEVPNTKYGMNGTFIFADSGLVQDPTSEQLADIAFYSSKSFAYLTGGKAYTAMISHSTLGSAKHPLVDKVVEATRIAKEKYPDLCVDGELQVDAALDREVAQSKAPNSFVAGRANVLVFPNLDVGNSAYKLVERLAQAQAYGPITQGFSSPVNDLSRGCRASDIVGVVAITAVQAEEK